MEVARSRRRQVREVQVHRRYGALTAGERLEIREIEDGGLALAAAACLEDDGEESTDTILAAGLLFAIADEMMVDHTVLPPSV